MNGDMFAKISKFADDTKLSVNVAKEENTPVILEGLRKIGVWSTTYPISFNVGKCNVMHIGYRNLNQYAAFRALHWKALRLRRI